MPEAESSADALRKITSVPQPLPSKRPRQANGKAASKGYAEDNLESLSEGDNTDSSAKKSTARGKKAKGRDGKPVRGESTDIRFTLPIPS
jgi:hypothetical protein